MIDVLKVALEMLLEYKKENEMFRSILIKIKKNPKLLNPSTQLRKVKGNDEKF